MRRNKVAKAGGKSESGSESDVDVRNEHEHGIFPKMSGNAGTARF
jgi:hypothetical protein